MVQVTLGAASVYKKVKVSGINSCSNITFKVGHIKTRDIIGDLWLKVISPLTFFGLVYTYYSNYPDAPLLLCVILACFIWGLLWLLFAATYAVDVMLEDKT